MKNYYLILPLLIGVIIAGCDSDEPLTSSMKPSDIEEYVQTLNSKYASKEDVNAVVSSIFGTPRSRAEESSREISLVTGKKREPAYYIVNMPEDGGFVLVSAVKDYTPILAYSTTGNFTADAYTLPGIADWIIDITNAIDVASEAPDSILEQAHIQWNVLASKMIFEQVKENNLSRSSDIGDRNNHPELIPIMEDSIASWQTKGWEVCYFEDYGFTSPTREEMIQNMQSAADWRYIEDAAALTLIVRKTDFWSSGSTPNLNGIKWNQTEPWNYSYPLVNDGQHAVAGCVPVAVGQFMYYNKYPTTFNWNAMRATYATSETQAFLFLLADRMNANYNKSDTGNNRHTSVSTSNMINVLKSYSYTISESNRLDQAGFPCIVTSDMKKADGKTSGHAYLLCGSSSTISTESIDCWTFTKKNSLNPCYQLDYNATSTKYYYVNWGWGGYCDGIYIHPETGLPNKEDFVSNKITKYITPRH
ncbi:MAG: C10 family peptidase [Muribaculaceae bacterium]|nr:C10 family peptidase [Muribaculaceae bacterium]